MRPDSRAHRRRAASAPARARAFDRPRWLLLLVCRPHHRGRRAARGCGGARRRPIRSVAIAGAWLRVNTPMHTPSEHTLSDIATAVSAGRPMDAEMVKRTRQILFGEERLVARMLSTETIDRAEADLLFRIHRSLARDRRDPSWHQLLAEAITSHVLKDETSPDTLDDAEANYLLARIHRDDDV